MKRKKSGPLKVLNAQREVSLISFSNAVPTDQGEWKQFLLQVVEKYRQLYIRLNKQKTLRNS